MRQKFIRKIRIMVSAAAAAALICGCTAGQAGSVKTTEAPREETGDPAEDVPGPPGERLSSGGTDLGGRNAVA